MRVGAVLGERYQTPPQLDDLRPTGLRLCGGACLVARLPPISRGGCTAALPTVEVHGIYYAAVHLVLEVDAAPRVFRSGRRR